MDKAELLHLATLSGLSLDPSEEKAIVADLGRILAYIGDLARVDTTDVEPLESPSEGDTPLREDVLAARDEEFLSAARGAAPETRDGAFVVPGFLD